MKTKLNFKIDNHSLKILIIYFSFISALELLAYGVGGFFSCVAAYVWLFTGIFWLGYFLFYVGLNIKKDVKAKDYLLAGVFLGLILLFLFFIGNVSFSDINPDSAQQLAEGLRAFEKPDLGYTGTAFLGYPARQYLIAAIPAYIFGANLWTLHAGFGLMFLIGLTVLFFGLRDWLKKEGIKEIYVLLPCFALLAFPFITEYYMNFEQAITPVALTMLAIGLFLKLLVSPNIIIVYAISYVGCLMADSYTPVLASLGLLLVFLLINALSNIYKKALFSVSEKEKLSSSVGYACIGCAANIFSFFIATYISGRSDRITEFRENTSVFESAFSSIKEFLTDANVRFLGIFGGLIILYMVLSLTGRLLLIDALISLWVLGVVFFSDYMVGYASYEKAWLMQRNMIVIPVLITCIFLAILRIVKKHGLHLSKPVFIILLIFFFFAGLFNFRQPHNSFRYFRYVQPMKYAIDYISDTLKENGMKNTDEFCLVIYTDNGLEGNIHDYASFFFPNAITYSESGDVYDEWIDASKICLFFAEDDRLKTLEPENGHGSEDYIRFLRTSMDSQTYTNLRYDSEITWYRKVMKP